MRGQDSRTEALFAYVTPESFVPKSHPLRAIRTMADEALKGMDKPFDSMYATSGRDSIPPEKNLLLHLLYPNNRKSSQNWLCGSGFNFASLLELSHGRK